MRIAVIVLMAACGGQPVCNICDSCHGASTIRHVQAASVNAIICWCERVGAGPAFLGTDVTSAVMPEASCESAAATWTAKVLPLASGACLPPTSAYDGTEIRCD